MRAINKDMEPPVLRRWKHEHPDLSYRSLSEKERRAIREAALIEQRGLCAFCCAPTSLDKGRNAHLRSQQFHPQKSLDWNNIVVSCPDPDHCDVHQGRKELPLTPLMPECEKELKFYQSGTVEGLTERARQTIEVLHLNCDVLRYKRKSAILTFLYGHEYFPPEQDLSCWDAELLGTLLEICFQEHDGQLLPYAPVLANVVRHCLRSITPPQSTT